MEGFDYVHREPVRFRDLDGMGHVNNAVFLTYIEQARFEFLAERASDMRNLILARVEIDYRAPVGIGETIDVGVRAGRIGTKSFELEYELRSGDRVVAEARSVQVGYDYDKAESIPLTDDWKRSLAA